MSDGRPADGPLVGRRALVTGGGRGLGRAIATALAAAGADVAVAGRDPASLADTAAAITAAGRRAAVVVGDLLAPGGPDAIVAEAVAALGGLDVLVNNSGVTHVGPAVDTTDDVVATVLGTNVAGTFACTRAAGRHFVAQGSGKVVNIASNLGLVGRSQFAVYCASKAAIIGMTRALALEWARYGVQVNAIAPGLVETDMNAELRADAAAAAAVVGRIPARRMARPEEIAPLVVHLASAAADYMVGETIVIDGGEVAG